MGRRKIEMKRISDKSSRQVTFTKRRGGLMKKARELSVLCDVDVALLVFSAHGKLFEFSSSTSVPQIIQRYSRHNEAEEMISTGAESRFAGFVTSSELLEIIESQLEGPQVDRLSAHDLAHIESQIDAVLFQIRSRKTQLMLNSITALHEKEKTLREENSRLVDELDVMVTDRDNTGEVLTGNINLMNNQGILQNVAEKYVDVNNGETRFIFFVNGKGD